MMPSPFFLSIRVTAMIRLHGSPWWRFNLAGREIKVVLGTEVMTDSGNWAGNGLRFATKEEAAMYVAQFSSARNTRVIESFEPVNYRWDNGQLVRQE
jgi:hypothetical protein